MKFKNDKVYCLHNTGNNFETIFFSNRNKKYFKDKIKTFVAPFAKVLYTSLQHNQFFIVIKTHKKIDLGLFSKNIGIMLGSYARGVNKEQKRLGSLFRKETKAFKKFSEFPTRIKTKFSEFRKFFEPSRLVNFKESAVNFFSSLDQSITSKNKQFKEANLYEILRHPLGVMTDGYRDLLKFILNPEPKPPSSKFP